MKKKGIKVLHIITKEIRVLDIPRVLDELGYTVYTANLGTCATGFHQKDSVNILHAIDEFGVDCVTSYDFSESISRACLEADIPYIAWVFDAPQKELYTHYALYPCNYIFVFDKMQYKRMKDIGIQNIYFMPLAIHGEKIKKELTMKQPCELCDASFVGSLYFEEGTEAVVALAPENIGKEVYECIDQNFMNWSDERSIYGSMSEATASYFDGLEETPIEERYPYITKEFYFETAVLSRMLAHRERIHTLNVLAEKHNVRLYTFDKNTDGISDKVKICEGIRFDAGISCVYRDSKININSTLHCIETGACHRIFEVMAAGGFLLSNYQKELEELFIPGKEIALYHNEEELLQLVDYYLAHEEERKTIARNGQRKVLAYHTLHTRFQRIMEIVYENEKGRKEAYLTAQKNELTKLTNLALQSGKKEELDALYHHYYQSPYDLAIRKNTELGVIKEMINLWKEINILNDNGLFTNVHSIEDAERRYLRTKFVLFRVENDCNYESCRNGLQELLDENISCAFMAWHIKANLSEKRNMYLKLSEYLWEMNPTRGLEIISYGLFDFPEDADMLMYKANYLLELQYYQEALNTLKLIKEPGEDILEIIAELETALGKV